MKKQGDFFSQVYEVVALIPKGKVMTYGQIAGRLGGFHSGRVVGFAMRAAPGERLPCHRVVNMKGEMAPGFCFGGAENQRRLLKREGVRFLPDGRIDMAKSQVGQDEEPAGIDMPKRARRRPKEEKLSKSSPTSRQKKIQKT